MSEFIEIGDTVFRKSDIKHVTEIKTGSVVLFCDGSTGRFSEPYQSVRRKLLGEPSSACQSDAVDQFVDQLCRRMEYLGNVSTQTFIREFHKEMKVVVK